MSCYKSTWIYIVYVFFDRVIHHPLISNVYTDLLPTVLFELLCKVYQIHIEYIRVILLRT